MSGKPFDGEEFGTAIVDSVKAYVNARCSVLEAKIARLEILLEAKNFAAPDDKNGKHTKHDTRRA
jgi:hypothetical protein